MKWGLFITAVATGIVFGSCGKSHDYDASVKQLDSLKVVMEESLSGFASLDSAKYADALSKEVTYTAFIQMNVTDTISRQEALMLQELHTAGKAFRGFLSSRRSLIDDARISASQLKKLSADLASGAVDSRVAIQYISQERQEAERIIHLLKLNTEVLRSEMEDYTRSLPGIEALVKAHNNGQLPPTVTPDI